MSLLECVPNVSEGRDSAIISRIAQRADSIAGAAVIHVDSNPDANRTVYTLVGQPDALVEAMMELAATAIESIDMRSHSGVHNRLGALDVAPFVPLSGMSLEDARRFAQVFGKRLFSELSVPVYWYEACATSEARRSLSKVRGKGYGSLAERYREQKLLPDLMTSSLPLKTGATVVGAREILLAYNVNLATDDVELASCIAKQIRTSGWSEKKEGSYLRHPGRLESLRAIGWAMEGYGNAQVSMNLLDYRKTGLYESYTTCQELAADLGTTVVGSELIGMLPEAALLDVAKSLPGGMPGAQSRPEEAIESAVSFLGLNSLREFIQADRILEYRIAAVDEKLLS